MGGIIEQLEAELRQNALERMTPEEAMWHEAVHEDCERNQLILVAQNKAKGPERLRKFQESLAKAFGQMSDSEFEYFMSRLENGGAAYLFKVLSVIESQNTYGGG